MQRPRLTKRTVQLNGQTYEVELGTGEVFVIKTYRGSRFELPGIRTYRQRITSAPKIKKLIKMAQTLKRRDEMKLSGRHEALAKDIIWSYVRQCKDLD